MDIPTEWDPFADLAQALETQPFDPETVTVALAGVRIAVMDALLRGDRTALLAMSRRFRDIAFPLVRGPQARVEAEPHYHLGRVTGLADVAADGARRMRPVESFAWVRNRQGLVQILERLYSVDYMIRHTDLKTALDVDAGQLTKQLDTLEEAGLVVSDRSMNRRYLRLSTVGRAVVEEDLRGPDIHLSRASKNLTPLSLRDNLGNQKNRSILPNFEPLAESSVTIQ